MSVAGPTHEEARVLDAAASAEEAAVGLRLHLPEPADFWIRFAPRTGRGWRAWPGPDRPWLDLTHGGRPVWSAAADRFPSLPDEPLDDLLYLPPVAAEWTAARDAAARAHAQRGTPVLMQWLTGEAAGAAPEDTPGDTPGDTPDGAVIVVDLLAGLLDGDPDALGHLPPGAAAVWPLLPGLTDDPDLWRRGCGHLAAAGVTAVQAVVPTLRPADRRRLAEGRDESTYHALFHRPAPDPRSFAREAWRQGLSPFLDRPLPRPPLRGRANRRLAGLLALAGELWHRLGRPAGRGQRLFRAARETDRTSLDLAALAREGNLGVLTWLAAPERSFVEEALAGEDRPALLRELWQEYLS